MNAEKLFKLAMVVFVATTIIGCFDSSDNDSSNGSTNAPEIEMVSIVVCNPVCYLAYPHEAYIGDVVYSTVRFFDEDSDLRTLYINHFHESDDFTTAILTQTAQIPPAQTAQFNYTFVDDPFTASAPTGHWKIRYYAVDEAGNESNEYEFEFLVR